MEGPEDSLRASKLTDGNNEWDPFVEGYGSRLKP